MLSRKYESTNIPARPQARLQHVNFREVLLLLL
jgi:hypothetical protein